VGIHASLLTASLFAVLSAINRVLQGADEPTRRRMLSQLEVVASAA
jgi:hypothetical protein